MAISNRSVHLTGVGGVGMAGLALLLKSRGLAVSGCDLHASARTRWLEGNGIPVTIGHDPAHIKGMDEVIFTPAVHPDAPEFVAAKRTSRVRYRGEVLAELVSERESIAVCGSHGKTTTSTWIAKLLKALGEDVAWCIGGETGSFPVAGVGKGVLVVEADESDGTLALYHPSTLVVNKLEYDHPDHFKTEADYFACFEQAKSQAKEVIDSEELAWTDQFSVLDHLPTHNRKNARAAIEIALRRGYPLERILAVMSSVVAELPDRRFQKIREGVYTDYAHHPTEIGCAVKMARAITEGKLRVLFQPHRHSRTKALLKDFPTSFAGADEVILCPTYAAFEPAVEGGDIADLYKICRDKGLNVMLAQSCFEAWEHARNSYQEGDLTLLLGAGDIIKVVDQLDERRPRKFYLGMGSNTWRSDLKLDIEYAKTSGPAGESGVKLVKTGVCPWMAGIPGTIGGWIKMNAGAFGHSISEILDEVKVDGVWKKAVDCGFAYRHSSINGEIEDYRLKNDLPIDDTDYLSRRKKFPSGTYGSFFKNPSGDFAGRLLEAAGAKELRVGGAYVWSEHANVIVRGARATNSDVLALARLMRAKVWFRFGIALEPEVQGINLEAL